LEERKQKYKKSVVRIRTHVLLGLSVVDKIVKFADENKVEIIVICSMGLKGIYRFLRGLGSVSRSIQKGVCMHYGISILYYFLTTV
jgi:nucleotide-binding universal stress UspA family protein